MTHLETVMHLSDNEIEIPGQRTLTLHETSSLQHDGEGWGFGQQHTETIGLGGAVFQQGKYYKVFYRRHANCTPAFTYEITTPKGEIVRRDTLNKHLSECKSEAAIWIKRCVAIKERNDWKTSDI